MTGRVSGLLVASLALSALTALAPHRLGPVGPFAAGLLAFLGYRAVRRSGGAIRGPVLARVAMTAALALLLAVAWQMSRGAPAARALSAMRAEVDRVERNLRSGTPEGAWELLDPAAREGRERAAFVKGLREALAPLGPLEAVDDARRSGGDWDRTGSFGEGASAELLLPVEIDARFRGGPGRIRLEVRVRREGDAVTAALRDLRVERLPR